MWCLQARRPEREQRETAGSTATFSLTVDDLPDVFKLSGSCFSSARRWRGSAGEWEGKRGQMRERGGFQRGLPSFILTEGFGPWCTGDGHHWVAWAAVRGGIMR
jgi:hypothetical protein